MTCQRVSPGTLPYMLTHRNLHICFAYNVWPPPAANALCRGEADITICWDGGRHHAQKSQASGFCYVADCVLAILALKRVPAPGPSPRKPRIMYLDLDLHFSNGVSHAFSSSSSTSLAAPQVLTLSIHHSAPGFFPVSALSSLPNPSDYDFDPFTLSLPLVRGASCTTFARIWPAVERVKAAFAPDFVVVQCGVDGLAGDPYAVWNWALGGAQGSLGWCIDRICREWGCKVLLLGGGGYNSPNAARAWTYLTSIAVQRDFDSLRDAYLRVDCSWIVQFHWTQTSRTMLRSRSMRHRSYWTYRLATYRTRIRTSISLR
ncbi:hypothetical protein AcV5_000444 [Taiwanofungus camphoratus]|nr:hypothetical protein AcV7_003636 [Antrodia cinnamomea]KAI0938857.1 hypothetical protein AcV5_000444 [Antrodia cinnamomea]